MLEDMIGFYTVFAKYSNFSIVIIICTEFVVKAKDGKNEKERLEVQGFLILVEVRIVQISPCFFLFIGSYYRIVEPF